MDSSLAQFFNLHPGEFICSSCLIIYRWNVATLDTYSRNPECTATDDEDYEPTDEMLSSLNILNCTPRKSHCRLGKRNSSINRNMNDMEKSQKKDVQLNKPAKPEVTKPAAESLKRTLETKAEDAKEQARKLLKSGAIKLESDSRDKISFKRSKHWEKKSKDSADRSSLNFQPFLSQYEDDNDDDPFKSSSQTHQKDYENDRKPYRRDKPHREPPPKRGNAIYIRAHGITEDIARKVFAKFGKIIGISIEADNNCGFVTFESMDSSDEAIREMNDTKISELFSPLKVSVARLQPKFESDPEPCMGTSWSSIAASSATRGSAQKEKREIVSYDDDLF